jgi:integrase/recombinase XerD
VFGVDDTTGFILPHWADSEMKRKALENAYLELIPDELPKWEKDGVLLSWLNNLCD